MTSAVETSAPETPRIGVVRRVSWRTWMLVRTFGRVLRFLAKSVYVGLAIAAIGALGFGLLTLTAGGMAADVLAALGITPAEASREVMASLATLVIVVGAFAAAGIDHWIRHRPSPTAALRRAGNVLRSRASDFADEWRSAGAERAHLAHRRRQLKERNPRSRPGEIARRKSGEPIRAHRTWLVAPTSRGGGACLVAPVTGQVWPDGQLIASCESDLVRRLSGDAAVDHPGPAPDLDCLCGIYALKRSMWPPPRHRAPLASGVVALTGRVIEATRGYRAERATIDGPLRVAVWCAGIVDGTLWTPETEGFWQPTPPNPCPFQPEVLAVGAAEYIGFCALHARRAEDRLGQVALTTPAAVRAQLELRYGVDVEAIGRGHQWT